MAGRVLFESCVDSLPAALASEVGGADRLELCADLDAGGTTPDVALVGRVVDAVSIPVFAMARPRGGSFVYTADELRALERDVRALKAAGAHGIVAGALTPAGEVDVDAIRRVLDVARPLPVTFHRAFDQATDVDRALDTLVALSVDRVLTSGGAPSAPAGVAALRRLNDRAFGRLIVVAGGGVRPHNVAAIVDATGVREVHARLITTSCTTADEQRAARAAVDAMCNVLRTP